MVIWTAHYLWSVECWPKTKNAKILLQLRKENKLTIKYTDERTSKYAFAQDFYLLSEANKRNLPRLLI